MVRGRLQSTCSSRGDTVSALGSAAMWQCGSALPELLCLKKIETSTLDIYMKSPDFERLAANPIFT